MTTVGWPAEPFRKEASTATFERLLLPHQDAAYSLARWLTRNDQDAEDMVQESYLRALKSFNGFLGGDGRAWLLTIVRNTCYTWLRRNRANNAVAVFDEEVTGDESEGASPESLLLESLDTQYLNEALDELPEEFREIIVLRELQGLSYKELSAAAGIPLGTVMSRLARARKQLRQLLVRRLNRDTLEAFTVRDTDGFFSITGS